MEKKDDGEPGKTPAKPSSDAAGSQQSGGDTPTTPGAVRRARNIYEDTMMVSSKDLEDIAQGKAPTKPEREAEAPADEAPTRKAERAPASDLDSMPTPIPGLETLVEVKGLTKHYGAIRAVDGIDFSVRRGDVLAFLGPNGAGKTTAMKMITGFLEPDSGSVRVCGMDVATQSLQVRRRIGYLPENAPAYGEMTVRAFLEFVLAARGLDDGPARIERVVGMTGLGSVLPQQIETLSKGYKRRVGLAQALIHDPEVLILDEPTDGLDPNQKALVHELISSLSAHRSIIVSTHILDEAERICNRVVILSEGMILLDSTPRHLMEQAPDHNVIRIRFEGHVPERVIGRVRDRAWCESAAVKEDGTMVIKPRDGKNHLTEVLVLLEDLPVRDVRLHEGRLDELFRKVTKGVAA